MNISSSTNIVQRQGSQNKPPPISYHDYIATRANVKTSSGLQPIAYPTSLFDFQKPIVDWALQRGRAALFMDTGLGKTACQVHWAKSVNEQTNGAVLLLAPLAVAAQTIREAQMFGITIIKADPEDTSPQGLVITNYEHLQKFSPELFAGLVLDEYSIMKGLNGKTRAMIQGFGDKVEYKLSCTATPSPNDFMELGTQSEFLGVMKQSEMLAMYFTHDSARTSKWRLKGHAKERFFEWMASWAVVLKNPRDIGFNGDAYDLPPLNHHEYIVGEQSMSDKELESAGLQIRGQIRKESMQERCEKVADIVAGIPGDEQVLIWCNLNDESKLLTELIDNAVEVKGADKPEHKEKSLIGFQDNEIKRLISKPRIAGFGLNLQSCNQMVFTGLSDSWEQYYQAVRRVWRFGQQRPVDIHVVSHANEGRTVANIKRKDEDNNELSTRMRKKASAVFAADIAASTYDHTEYTANLTPDFPLL